MKKTLKTLNFGFLLLLLSTVQFLLMLFSFRKTQTLIKHGIKIIPTGDPHLSRQLLNSRWTSFFPCLNKALLLHEIYRKNNIFCKMHIGVQKSKSEFAHAWVVVPQNPQWNFLESSQFQPLISQLDSSK